MKASVQGLKLIEQAMAKLGIMSQTELATKAGYQQKTIQRFLNDGATGVSREAAINICKALHLTLEQVTGIDGPPIPNDTPIAIAFTDIVGSTNILKCYVDNCGDPDEGDRQFVESILKPHREKVEKLLVQHQGHLVKWTGDGYLAYFSNVNDAVNWAIAVQNSHISTPIHTPNSPSRRLQTRIGIHWGKYVPEVINNSNDLSGNNVVFAQRIMSKGHGEQIVLSDAAKFACGDQLSDVKFYDHGQITLKDFGNPQIWEVLWGNRQPLFIGLDWISESRQMLSQQIERERDLRRNITRVEAEVDVYVPLGLVKPKADTTRKRLDTPTPGDEMGMSQLKEEEITQKFEHGQFLDEVIGKWNKNLAIVGEPGSGKSTWLTEIAKYLVDKQELVILLPLGSVNVSNSKTMDQVVREGWLTAVTQELKAFIPEDKSSEAIYAIYKELEGWDQPIWLLLDGVDEISGGGDPILPIQQLLGESWVGKNKRVRIILSCRQNVWVNNLNTLPGFETYRTIDFNSGQVLDFVGRWFASPKVNQPEKGKRLQTRLEEATKNGERIAELVRNPLRLAMVCQSWLNNEANLPKTKADLYQAMRRNLYEWKNDRFPLSMGQKRFPLSMEQIRELNGALSLVALKSIETSQLISERMAYEVMGESQFKLAKEIGWINQTHIDSGTREPYFGFYHYSFKEFFAAEGVSAWDYFMPRDHRGKPVPDKTYRVFDPSWKEVILLWLGRDDVPLAEKKAFLGVDSATGLAQFMPSFGGSGDGCGDFYGWKAAFLQIQATAEVTHIQDRELKDWVKGRIRKLVECAFGKYYPEQGKWVNYEGHPVETNARENLLAEADRATILAELSKLLNNPDIDNDTRWQAAKSLGRIDPGNETAIQSLVTLLANPDIDEYARRKAAETLGTIGQGNETAIQSLVTLLANPDIDEYARREAAESLGRIDPGNETAIQSLVTLLANPDIDEYARRKAAETLGTIGQGNETAIQSLVTLLANPDIDEYTRWQAAKSLGRIDPGNETAIQSLVTLLANPDIDEFTRMVAAESLGTIGQGNETAIQSLVTLLANPDIDEYARRKAAETLGTIGQGNETAIQSLVTLLANPDIDDDTRWQAAKSLGRIGQGNETAIQSLVTLLANPDIDDDTRRLAAKSLGTIGQGNETAIQSLVTLLANPDIDEYARREAAESLGRIDPGNETAIQSLVTLLANPDIDEYARRKAAESLGRIGQGNETAIQSLVTLLANPDIDKYACRQAARSLGRIDPGNETAIQSLVTLLANPDIDNDTRRKAAESLGRIGQGNETAIQSLVTLLANPDIDKYARWEAAESLGRIGQGNETAIQSLVTLLANPAIDKYARWKAAESLGRIGQGNETAIQSLVTLLANPAIDKYARWKAAESLGRIDPGNETAIQSLVTLLANPDIDNDTRWKAAESLGRIDPGNETAIQSLVTLLANPDIDNDTRKEAAESLQKVLEQATPDSFLRVVDRLSRIELDGDVYKVLWQCAQKLPYEGSQGFYAAWNHQLPVAHHPEAPDTQPAGRSTLTATLEHQIINPSSIQSELNRLHTESTLIPLVIDCSRLTTITDSDTLAARLSNKIFAALSQEPPEVERVAQLERHLIKLTTTTQKSIAIALFAQDSPQNILQLFQDIGCEGLHIRHFSSTTQEELMSQITAWLAEF